MPYASLSVPFLIFFSLTLLSISAGDGEAVYKFLDRKPTGNEAIARIRFVMVRLIASISGGCLMALIIGRDMLRDDFSLAISKDQRTLLAVLCIGVTHILIEVVHNIIRHMQGRRTRPIFDPVIIKHNYEGWLKYFGLRQGD
jgi:hypothetical protein